jgi:phosphocarrier protein HPr
MKKQTHGDCLEEGYLLTQENEQAVVNKVRVQNQEGLHARPAASIVRILSSMNSRVTFTYKKQTVDAHSVLGLLMLAVPKNGWITMSAVGPDASLVIEKLEKAFHNQFREPDCG